MPQLSLQHADAIRDGIYEFLDCIDDSEDEGYNFPVQIVVRSEDQFFLVTLIVDVDEDFLDYHIMSVERTDSDCFLDAMIDNQKEE